MALSSAEQMKVMQLLGFPGKVLDPTSISYNKITADRLANLLTDLETLARGYLTTIAALETQINAAPARLAAKKVDDLEMNLEELQMLRRERKKQIRELADLLDLPYQGGGVNVSVCV
jgi:hypothetical protein